MKHSYWIILWRIQSPTNSMSTCTYPFKVISLWHVTKLCRFIRSNIQRWKSGSECRWQWATVWISLVTQVRSGAGSCWPCQTANTTTYISWNVFPLGLCNNKTCNKCSSRLKNDKKIICTKLIVYCLNLKNANLNCGKQKWSATLYITKKLTAHSQKISLQTTFLPPPTTILDFFNV
jgi:hypothetical protein